MKYNYWNYAVLASTLQCNANINRFVLMRLQDNFLLHFLFLGVIQTFRSECPSLQVFKVKAFKDFFERRLPLCLRWLFPPLPSGPHADYLLHRTAGEEEDPSNSVGGEATDRKKTDECANQWHRHIQCVHYSLRLMMVPLKVTAVLMYKWKKEMANKTQF